MGTAATGRITLRAEWGPEIRTTLALAWPLVLTNLSQFALSLTDALFLGRVSTEALAAATLGGNLFFATLAPAFGLALAAGPMCAQTRGRGRGHLRGMRRDVRAAFWAVAAATVPIWLLLWHTQALLGLLGQEPALAALAGQYVRALMWGMPLFCGFVVLRGFLAAEQRPLSALVVSFAGVALNVPLNYWLIHGGLGVPALGAVGAGIASSLCNLAMFAGLVGVIARDRHLRRYHLFGRLWRYDLARLREVAQIGLPIAGSMALEIAVFAFAAIAMGWFGAIAVAAHAIAVQIASATFMVPMGIAQAATARVGLMTGAGRVTAAARAGWIGIALGAGFMAASAGALVLLSGSLAWLFLAPGNAGAAETAALAATMLVVAGLFQLADGVQAVASGALRGLKDTTVPMLLAGFGYWVIGLPLGLALALPGGFGPIGLWVGLATGLFLVAGLMLARWVRLSASGGLTLRRRLG
ncbi:MATE family efflux transporter [Falsiroseomonas selenitidurans]|uniref:Multidrug-efflux transporter n=1 Tax=Falsiroseomonas selenitidurans TaxID=2716335 RepID=A0ABX1E491_9PROT|nr:MATE family efflux transporter [Falsiroseomonas selenitidurans]NKC31818.1 MATE family efflux transporter [Falsiroseomonas selenitidurans]